MNYLVRKQDPAIPRDYLHQVLFNFWRIVVLCKLEPARDTVHVGVNDHSVRHTKPRTENYISGLASDTGNGEEFIHSLRDFSAEVVHDRLCRAHNGLRLITEEPRRANIVFEFFGLQYSEMLRRRVLLKQSGSDHVDAHVGALRREDRRYQKFPRIRVM